MRVRLGMIMLVLDWGCHWTELDCLVAVLQCATEPSSSNEVTNGLVEELLPGLLLALTIPDPIQWTPFPGELVACECANVLLYTPFSDGSGQGGGGGILGPTPSPLPSHIGLSIGFGGTLFSTNFRLGFRPANPGPLPVPRLRRWRLLQDDYDVPLAAILRVAVTTVADKKERTLTAPLSALDTVCDLRVEAADLRVFLFSFKVPASLVQPNRTQTRAGPLGESVRGVAGEPAGTLQQAREARRPLQLPPGDSPRLPFRLELNGSCQPWMDGHIR